METIIDFFSYPFAIRALMASGMVGIMCGMLGAFIVLRNMSLIGDALSHAILPGVVVGFLVAGYSIMGFFTGSVLAGLVAAVLITWIQRNVKTHEDAAIGIVFTSMFALGVMGISYLTHQEGVHLDLKDFLFGNVLGIGDQDLWLTFSVMLFTMICIAAFYRFLFITTFESVVARTLGFSVGTIHYFLMLLLAFAVVASLQSVGVILVVSMLITPASTAYLLTRRLQHMIILSGLIGLLAAVLGLLAAVWLETTPGPAMTVTATVLYGLAVLFAPDKGLVSRFWTRWSRRRRIFREDILKQAVRLSEQHELKESLLAEKLKIKPYQLRLPLARLISAGDFLRSEEGLELSEKGMKAGYQLIRAHRIWETYLVEKLGLSQDQIHDDAESREHLLPEAFLAEVSQSLGNPQFDPHGSPIPAPPSVQAASLLELAPGDRGRISLLQPDSAVRARLWELGLTRGATLERLENEAEGLQVKVGEVYIRVEVEFAQKVRVEK